MNNDGYPECHEYHRAVEVLDNICLDPRWSLRFKLLACPLRRMISKQHHKVRVLPEVTSNR